jgi:hypothetical protein
VKVRRKGAVLRLDLHGAEPQLLNMLFDDFFSLLDSSDAEDPVIQRLYPDGYTDDERASAEYRELVAMDLREERTGRLQACRAELADGASRVELDEEAAERWIRVLNDLRLALGTRLGVTEDDELDGDEQAVTVYQWLTAAQDMLVTNLME